MGKDQDLLAHVWGLYRVYAKTSRKIKSNATRYRSLVIMFTIVAAISGVLTTQFPDGTIFPLSVFGFLSAASFSLATFFSREIIKSAYEKKHIIARSAAEALKSQSYLYATGPHP